MAAIDRTLFLRHLRAGPNFHVRHHRSGRLVRAGEGLSFWFHPQVASLAEIPVGDRELSVAIEARSSDFQDVALQAALMFRIAAPALAAARIDFSIDPETGAWTSDPVGQLEGMLTELVRTHALETLAAMPLADALSAAVSLVRDRMETRLRSDPRIAETGVEVAALRITAMRADPEVERALQTPARELVQQEADRAAYDRRALAMEQERTIGRSELETRIELAKREEELVLQQGRNEWRRAEGEAEAWRILAEAETRRERMRAEAQAEAVRLVGQAEADSESARIAVYQGVAPATIVGLAVKELAGNLPAIGALTVTPDMLSPLLARLGLGPASAALPDPTGRTPEAGRTSPADSSAGEGTQREPHEPSVTLAG